MDDDSPKAGEPQEPAPEADHPARAGARGQMDERSRSDRRRAERRKEPKAVPEDRRTGADRRTGKSRRKRSMNQYDMSEDVLEFVNAINRFKERSGRPFPAWSEVLEILRGLGYEKPGSET